MTRKGRLSTRIQKKLEELDSGANPSIFDDVEDNEEMLRKTFSYCSDFVMKKINHRDGTPCTLVYIQGLVDSKHLEDVLINSLLKTKTVGDVSSSKELIGLIKEKLPTADVGVIDNLNDATLNIVNGRIVLFVDSSIQAVSMSGHGEVHRALDEPSTEALIRGPRVGFNEDIHTNMSLIRLRLRTPHLKMEETIIGTISRTKVMEPI